MSFWKYFIENFRLPGVENFQKIDFSKEFSKKIKFSEISKIRKNRKFSSLKKSGNFQKIQKFQN